MAYIFKDEVVIKMDGKNSATPVVEEFKRISKGETIAVYNNNNYEKYSEQINNMDVEIKSLIKDLPTVYSSDVTTIDKKISDISIKANKTNSYIKMQEYKTKLNELSYNKVLILGQLSPTGSKIRELIEKRKVLDEQRKKESDNITSSISGIVSYKLDGLEYLSDTNDILKYDISKLEETMNIYSSNNVNNFGIKIMNNFDAYIIVKQAVGENDIYIKKGKKYTLKLNDNNIKVTATLLNNISNEIYNYSIFKVENGIENLEDDRIVSIEIVWSRVEGLAVPITAIKKSKDNNYDYITMIKNSEYIDVPINITAISDNMCIIDNVSDEKKNELSINKNTKINIYDQILI